MSMLDYNPNTEYEDSSQISVWRSTDRGESWAGPVAVAPMGSFSEDKDLVAVDRTGGLFDGNLYIVWDRLSVSDGNRIVFARSTDGGESFDDTVVVGPTVITSNCGQSSPGLFSLPIVNSDGSVHLFWTGEHVDSSTCLSDYAVRHAYSLDGGETFSSDTLAFLTDHTIYGVDGGITVYEAPSGDADISGGPYDGAIYLAQTQFAQAGDYDIKVRKSTDNGISWLAPVTVNDDLAGGDVDQFHPWLIVNADGVVAVIFYDQRNDPVYHHLFDCYFAASFDGAETFTGNYRLSSVSSNPNNLLFAERALSRMPASKAVSANSQLATHIMAGELAEYIGVHASGNYVVATWTDLREGNQDVYSAHFTIPFMPPRLYAPGDDSSAPAIGVHFQWSTCCDEAEDAYRLEVSTDSQFQSIVMSLPNLADNNFDSPPVPAAGKYFWRVKAFRAAGDSTQFSRVFNFIACTSPGASPQLLSPDTGDTIAAPATTLAWSRISDASEYRMQLSVDSDFAQLLVDRAIRDTQYFASGLNTNWGTYYWRVNTTNACGSGDWARSCFVVCEPAVSPTVAFPLLGDTVAESTVVLDWATVADAVEYRVQLSTSLDFSSPLAEMILVAPGFTVSGLHRTRYFWRVNATNTCGIGQWSVSWFDRCPIEHPGDVNVNAVLTSADIIYLVNYVFKTGPAPLPITSAGDCNCSGSVTSADIIYLVNYVFKAGLQPCDVCSFLFGGG